ncbi:MAG: hypothetical protein QW424_02785 [Candidatus Bathyarchaeia archaeon]
MLKEVLARDFIAYGTYYKSIQKSIVERYLEMIKEICDKMFFLSIHEYEKFTGI